MKHFLPVLIVVLLGFASAVSAAPAKNEIVKNSLLFEGKKRTYYLFLPAGVSDKTAVPLVVTLHGSGRNGSSLVEKWKDLAASEGLIIAGPDSQNSQGWVVPQDGPEFLHALVEALKAKYPINPRRVYLFGHSAGAAMGLYMSLYESEYFAATAVHAGSLRPETYPLISFAKRKIPIFIMVGTRDLFFPLAEVRATRDELMKHGLIVQLTEIPNHDHWYYNLAPKINRDAWDFLKQQELSTDPRYEQYKFKQ
ncbi:MAG: alpha/beta hydrolase family esterase [Pyrinomonadaceae bacterium]